MNLIRPYRQTDQQSVLNLFQSNTPEYFDFSEKVELLDYLNHKLEDYFVVEQNGVVIGSGGINYFYEEKKARLSWEFDKEIGANSGDRGEDLSIFKWFLSSTRV